MARQKGINKEKVGFSIDKTIIEDLDSYCSNNLTTKSKLVNDLLKGFLESIKPYKNSKELECQDK